MSAESHRSYSTPRCQADTTQIIRDRSSLLFASTAFPFHVTSCSSSSQTGRIMTHRWGFRQATATGGVWGGAGGFPCRIPCGFPR